MGQERLQLQDAFAAYLHDPTQHPDVTVHHGGQTLSESEQIVTGFVLVIEAPSLEVAQAAPMLRRAPLPSLSDWPCSGGFSHRSSSPI